MPTTSEVSSSTTLEWFFVVPHREKHDEHIEAFKATHRAKILGAPAHPYSGSTVIVQLDSSPDHNTNTKALVTNFVKADPYVQNGLVESYSVDPIFMTNTGKDFDRLSGEFLTRF